jgi:hypothetical protein
MTYYVVSTKANIDDAEISSILSSFDIKNNTRKLDKKILEELSRDL